MADQTQAAVWRPAPILTQTGALRKCLGPPGDIGFQLSFAATLGLVLLAPPLRVRLKALLDRLFPGAGGQGLQGLLGESLILTLAAQITTVPLLVFHFGRLSLLSPLTNFLIVPAQPFVLSSGLAMIVLGLCWEPLGRIMAVVPWLLLSYTAAVVRWAATVPFASVDTGGLGQLFGIIGYVVLMGLWLLRRTEAGGRSLLPAPSRALLVTAPLLLLVLQLAGRPLLPDRRLHLVFLPAGGGEAVLVVTPEGRRVCVWDGRGDPEDLVRAVAGVSGGRDPAVHLFVGSGEAPWPVAAHVDPGQMAPGSTIRIGDKVILGRVDRASAEGISVRPAELENATGTHGVFSLSYGGFVAILPFGLDDDVPGLPLATDVGLHATVLKVPRTGIAPEAAAAVMAAASPQLVLWPEDGAFAPQLVASLGTTPDGIAHIPPGASVEVITDGTRLWLKQWSNESKR